MDYSNESTALAKSILLSMAKITFSDNITDTLAIQRGNLLKKEWREVRLNTILRVRLTYDEDAPYKRYSIGYKFCHLSVRIDDTHYSLNRMFSCIEDIKLDEIKNTSLIFSPPFNLSTSDVVDEMSFVIRKIKRRIKNNIPIDVSVGISLKHDLHRLKRHGTNEVKFILEIVNNIDNVETLAKLMTITTLYSHDSIKNVQGNFALPSAERLYYIVIEQKKYLINIHITSIQTSCKRCVVFMLQIIFSTEMLCTR